MSRSVSVKEMITLAEQVCHKEVKSVSAPARPGDQLFYVSDVTRFSNQTGWIPRRSLEQTIRDISAFWHASRMYVMGPIQARRQKSVGRAA